MENYYDLVEVMKLKLEGKTKFTLGFGHIGDGNLHLNIGLSKNLEETKKLIEPFVYDYVIENEGSISAEHGVGKLKKKYFLQMVGEESLAQLRAIKEIFDPGFILGKGNIF